MRDLNTIAALRIGLASEEDIRSWSHGEVTKPETIHYRTQQPVKDGLFCQIIFGPTRNWSCACGKYQRKRQVGFICEKCGVELAPATVRRERMGHIELAAPIAHPWHLRTIGLLLDLSPWQVTSLLAYQHYLVLQINEAQRNKVQDQRRDEQDKDEQKAYQHLLTLSVGDLLEEEQYRPLSLLFPDTFKAQTGAEAIQLSCRRWTWMRFRHGYTMTIAAQGTGQKKAIRRLQAVNVFRTSGQRPDWMVLSLLPVLPPELRPLLVLDGGRIASSDLNELYCRILHRNNRLKHFLGARRTRDHSEQRAPHASTGMSCSL